MKNKVPVDETEAKCLGLFKAVYGEDVLSFRYSGSEVVEMMAMAMKTGRDDAVKETK
jgi:ABC-type hemin transport system ATPase subunit